MCIIVAKKKGVKMPSKNILETCFNNNSDGAGLMYVQNGQVIIDKGYMDFKSFYKRLQKLERRLGDLTNKSIVMHFRIGTQGANDKATTHPFPISKDIGQLKATYVKTDVGMVHNGIISKFNYDKSISDTQLFIKDFVSVIKNLKKDFYTDNSVMQLLKGEIGSSKLCFLDKNENLYYIGEKFVDNGVVYSNTTYKSYYYKTPIYRYAYDYDYDYDYDYIYGYNKTSAPMETYKSLSVDEFLKKVKDFEILEVGDTYYSKDSGDQVDKKDVIIVDKGYNVYELYDNKVSLIAKNAVIYDKNFNLKQLMFLSNIL